MLAQSLAYDKDASALAVNLGKGIAFHSGAPLTSDDVVASLKRYSGSAGAGAVLKSLVSDISADSPDAVFTLTRPTGVVLGVLTLTPAVIMSKASLADASATKPVAKLDCTGRYRLTSYEPDRQARSIASFIISPGATPVRRAGLLSGYRDPSMEGCDRPI